LAPSRPILPECRMRPAERTEADPEVSWFKRIRVPHVFVLLTLMVLLASFATWLIPSGRYQRQTREIEGRERTLVVPGTYEAIPKEFSVPGLLLGAEPSEEQPAARPVSFFGFLTAIPRGLETSADIIFFIFIIGGSFGILQASGTIPAAIRALVDHLGHSVTLLTVAIMVVLAAGGSTLGMGEEFIPLVPVFLLIARRLGYDRIYGLAMVVLAADVGFAAATTNPFTVNIAQGIAELPLNSGVGLRIAFFVVSVGWTIGYVLRYGTRIRRDPRASLVFDDPVDEPEDRLDDHRFSRRHAFTLACCLAIFGGILYGVQTQGWWMSDMAGGFFLMGLVAAAVSRLGLGASTQAFIRGMQEMVVPALVVGFARGIQVVLLEGQILDTLIHSAASVLQTVPRYVSVAGMLLFQSTLNFVIPSGSGQAAVTMPLMAPLADVLGISRQTSVLAFQFGDGISNIIVPTAGVLMAMLAMARIPYGRWFRFVLPLFLQLMLLAAAFLLLAVAIDYS
jgi:uncharacterized ion transporter superfamily protein YfcC